LQKKKKEKERKREGKKKNLQATSIHGGMNVCSLTIKELPHFALKLNNTLEHLGALN
jgi:hypothetical protein